MDSAAAGQEEVSLRSCIPTKTTRSRTSAQVLITLPVIQQWTG